MDYVHGQVLIVQSGSINLLPITEVVGRGELNVFACVV